MQNLMLMTLGCTVQKLVKETLDLIIREISLVAVQKFLQILIEKFENKGQFFVCVEYIDKSHDIWMLQLFEKGDFSNGGTWNSFIF
jgi:hypothetical protein